MLNERHDTPWPRKELQINPFVFPAETRGRFIMLLVLALGICWTLGLLFFGLPHLVELFQTLIERAKSVSFSQPPSLANLHLQDPAVFRYIRETYALAFGILVRGFLFASLPVCLFCCLSFVFYWRHPARIRRQNRPRILHEEDAPTVVRALGADMKRLGINQPQLEWKPGLLDGLAYGRRGREKLVLGGTPRFLEMSWGDVNRAVALHELGHIVNRDIQTREWVRALWFALVITIPVMILLKVISLLWFGQSAFFMNIKTVFAGLVYLGFLLMGVWFMWAGLIRVREYYADWRVALWGMGKALIPRLKLPQSHRPWWARWAPDSLDTASFQGRLLAMIERFWAHNFHLHPSNRMRVETLNHPERMFSVALELAFLSGLLLAFVSLGNFALVAWMSSTINIGLQVISTGMLENMAESGRGSGSSLVLVALFFKFLPIVFTTLFLLGFTHLVTTSLGQQVQRQALWDLDHAPGRWGYLRLAFPSLIFSLGFAFGLYLAPFDFLRPKTSLLALFTAYWLAGVFFMTWLWMIHLRFLTRFTLGARTGFRIPTRLGRMVRWSATVMFCIFYWPIGASVLGLFLFNSGDKPIIATIIRSVRLTLNLDEKMFAGMVFALPAFMFMLAILFYIGSMLLSLLAVVLAFRRRDPQCAVCGEDTEFRFAIGRSCAGCGGVLANWLYIRPEFELTGRPAQP